MHQTPLGLATVMPIYAHFLVISSAYLCNDAISNGKTSIEEFNNQPSQDLQQAVASKPVSKYALSVEEQARIRNRRSFKTFLYPPQWIQCDLEYFNMSLLGKFSMVMADPPLDIHMEFPFIWNYVG